MRSAFQLGAEGVFTIGRRYKRQRSDIFHLTKHVTLTHHEDFAAFRQEVANARPGVKVVAIEKGGTPLKDFEHPDDAVYLLGAEDHGLSAAELEACDEHVTIEAVRQPMFNVSVAGSIVMYHRLHQRLERRANAGLDARGGGSGGGGDGGGGRRRGTNGIGSSTSSGTGSGADESRTSWGSLAGAAIGGAIVAATILRLGIFDLKR
eukprot:g4939.t1